MLAILSRMPRSQKVALAMAAFIIAMVPALAAVAAPVTPNYSWYSASASTYTITGANQLAGLAQLVNGTADLNGDGKPDPAVTFEDKTIKLSADANFGANNITPIGTKEHPFKGAFDGAGRTVNNFTIQSSDDGQIREFIGLFGYVGEGGSISNVNIGSNAKIILSRNANSKESLTHIGMLVGACKGTISNCANAGTITITSSAPQQSKTDYYMVRYVGGLAGACQFDVSGCSNSGTISITQDSSPNIAVGRDQLVACVGGIVGFLGDENLQGDNSEHKYTTPSMHGSISNCTNTAVITIDTPNQAGLDRFGMPTTCESLNIGGIVGYSQGSIDWCTNGQAKATNAGQDIGNSGFLNVVNGNGMGGIAGGVRTVFTTNTITADGDDGNDGKDPLMVSNCTNYGDVYGRVGTGGICGGIGSYVTVTQCINANKRDYYDNIIQTYVVSTRWNKPHPAGIVATCYGTIAYCANFGTVASAADRYVEKVQTGYYAAGITGFLVYHTKVNTSTGIAERISPLSEVYGCLNAGKIVSGENMRQRSIVGQNDGYTHDNVAVNGLCFNDDLVYGEKPEDDQASGTVGTNMKVDAADLRGAKAAEAIELLNALCESQGWKDYWIPAKDTSTKGVNQGYPLLVRQSDWSGSETSIASANITVVANAPYTGAPSSPELKVMLNGTELKANVDYRVVPDPASTDISMPNKPYQATVVGMGKYSGTAAQKPSYGVEKGSLTICTVLVEAPTFDYTDLTPKPDKVKVITPASQEVPSSEYTYEMLDYDGNPIDEVIDAGVYKIKVVAKEDSALFAPSELVGEFRVKQASLMNNAELHYSTISYLGQSYQWKHSTAGTESQDPSTTIPYNGTSINPTVDAITYRGHTLVEGVDYKVVYGNPDGDDNDTSSSSAPNIGLKGGTRFGCVTVRFIPGKCNFSSYANMFFKIVDTGEPSDLSKTRYVADDQIYDGTRHAPVEIYAGETKLAEGNDYTITYHDNVGNPSAATTATFVATGKGQFTGTLEGSFNIAPTDLTEIQYTFNTDGTATVTGVKYYGKRDLFDLEIPSSVKGPNGRTFTVSAIAANAFGGSSISGFSGSEVNDAKAKLRSITIPATVKSIGNYAFGDPATGTVASHLEEVIFADVENSQLESIGTGAFQHNQKLESFTFPAGVKTIGDQAFQDCTALTNLAFLSPSPTLPSTIGTRTFRGVGDSSTKVTVAGQNAATAVKTLAENNKLRSSYGKNGGRYFSFQAIQGNLADASIAAITDQHYTSLEVTPSAVVKLNGKTLKEGTDYTLAYEDNVAIGTATVTATGKGAYTGSISSTFKIVRNVFDTKTEFADIDNMGYTGSALQVPTQVVESGVLLVRDVDYTVAFEMQSGNTWKTVTAPKEIGAYRATVTGKGNYTGSHAALQRTFQVIAPTFRNAEILNWPATMLYTGEAITIPSAVVRVGDKTLVEGVDYRVTYRNNVSLGTATAQFIPRGEYAGGGTITKTFQIENAAMDDVVASGIPSVKYDNDKPVYPEMPILVNRKTSQILQEGTDYVFTAYADEHGNKLNPADTPAAGTEPQEGDSDEAVKSRRPEEAKLIFTGAGAYVGELKPSYMILKAWDENGNPIDEAEQRKKSLEGATVEVNPSTCDYTGAEQRPDVVVRDAQGNTLTLGADYILGYKDNFAPGTATLAVLGQGYYKGYVMAEFTIAQPDKSKLNAAIKAAQASESGVKTSTNGADVPTTQKWTTQAAKKALDDAIAAAQAVANREQVTQAEIDAATEAMKAAQAAYDAAKKPGKKQAPITTKQDISKATVTGVSDKWYAVDKSGKALAQTQKPVVKLNGKTLKEATDYKLTYANNKARTSGDKKFGPTNKATSATVTIAGIGSYTGKLNKTFQIKGVEVYRLYNPKSGEHLYTTDTNERKVLTSSYGWKYEGVAWYAVGKPARPGQPAQGTTTTKPVYRVYQPKTGEHHYTTDANEVKVLSTSHGWRNEGIFAYTNTDTAKDVAVQMNRLYNPKVSPVASHHHTADTNEVKVLTSQHGWKKEGISWYGC